MKSKSKEIFEYELCFVRGGRWGDEEIMLYFTELDVKKQKGDDWDDIPYEHNAETPNTKDYDKEIEPGVYEDIDILKLILSPNSYFCKLNTPCTGVDNSRYSVNDINNKLIPWVTIQIKDEKIPIWAGTTVNQFLEIINQLNNDDIDVDVYVPYNKLYKKESGYNVKFTN